MSNTPGTTPIYGNIIKPGRQGIFGLPVAVCLMGIPFVIVVILMVVSQWYLAGLGVAVAGPIAALLVTIRGRDGRNFYERTTVVLAHRQKTRRGDNFYVAGPTGKTSDGKMRVPGLLASSELTDHQAGFDITFGLIRVRSTNHYTVVFEAHPDGDALVDQSVVNAQVVHWGAWLAHLGVDDGIVGASVTIETARTRACGCPGWLRTMSRRRRRSSLVRSWRRSPSGSRGSLHRSRPGLR